MDSIAMHPAVLRALRGARGPLWVVFVALLLGVALAPSSPDQPSSLPVRLLDVVLLAAASESLRRLARLELGEAYRIWRHLAFFAACAGLGVSCIALLARAGSNAPIDLDPLSPLAVLLFPLWLAGTLGFPTAMRRVASRLGIDSLERAWSLVPWLWVASIGLLLLPAPWGSLSTYACPASILACIAWTARAIGRATTLSPAR